MNELVLTEKIAGKIYLIRGIKVILDRDLAELYGVETGALNRAVKRNAERFPITLGMIATELATHVGQISDLRGMQRGLDK